MKDLYKILGVAEDADDDTIKKAYRKLAKQNHPDATGGDKRKTERFKEIGDAYGVLGDKQKRAEYDRLRHAPIGSDGMPQGFDPDTFAQVFGGGAGGFPRGQRRPGGVHVTTEFGNGDLGDLFASLFGGGSNANPFGRAGGGFQRERPNRGPDMTGVLDVPCGTRRWGPAVPSATEAAHPSTCRSRRASTRAGACDCRARAGRRRNRADSPAI